MTDKNPSEVLQEFEAFIVEALVYLSNPNTSVILDIYDLQNPASVAEAQIAVSRARQNTSRLATEVLSMHTHFSLFDQKAYTLFLDFKIQQTPRARGEDVDTYNRSLEHAFLAQEDIDLAYTKEIHLRFKQLTQELKARSSRLRDLFFELKELYVKTSDLSKGLKNPVATQTHPQNFLVTSAPLRAESHQPSIPPPAQEHPTLPPGILS